MARAAALFFIPIILCLLGYAGAEDAKFSETSLGNKGRAEAIPEDVWQAMAGKSWHSNLPCPRRSELRLLHLPYIDFEGVPRTGKLIVADDVANEVIEIFSKLYNASFAIYSMRLIDDFGGDDAASMAANNTSGFNCRTKTAGKSMSEHSFGRAIDVNPIQNPFVTTKATFPKEGIDYNSKVKRQQPIRGMIMQADEVVKAFEAAGWKWGGNWAGLQDYQHFSKSGR